MRKIRVLHLGMTGSPWGQTLAVRSLTKMFTRDSRLDVISIDALAPIPSGLESVSFDLIVLSPTFLAARYSRDLLDSTQRKFAFIESSTALKVALPQDDYDCSSILDDWVTDWDVDLTYTICPHNWKLLYPRYCQTGRLRLGFTGYILENQVRSLASTKSWVNRSIDVSYRTAQLPPNFGALGYLKTHIVNILKQELPTNHNLELDLSTRSEDRITGRLWHSFLENSRFVLVSPSGSSLIDPYGDLRQATHSASVKHLTPDEFLSAVSQLRYLRCKNTMVSPRNIEACLLGTVQVAISDDYSGILQANDHYIPLESSSDLISRLRDEFEWNLIRDRARDAILSVPQLRATNLISELIREADIKTNVVKPASATFEQTSNARRRFLRKKAAYQTVRYWTRRRLQDRLEAAYAFLRSVAR